jgi:hypothetical protein
VDSTTVVTKTRTGAYEAPYATYQDAIDHFGVPTTQAEYELGKTIIFLDSADYTEDVVFPMGIWRVRLQNAQHTGTTDWEIDAGERFGSSSAPRLDIDKNVNSIASGTTGDIEVYLKSGGSAVSVLYVTLSGLIHNGNLTIADGTNLGTSCASLPVFAMYRATIFSGGNFKNRLALAALTQSNLASTGDLEIGYLTSVQNSTINSLNVLEARSSTTTKTIRDLTLNTSGGVTWDAASVRNWNVDAPSADEILNKITSYPSNTINLLKVGAEAISYDNTVSGLTADDVQEAIDELSSGVDDALPLAGGIMEGDIDMDESNINDANVVQMNNQRAGLDIVNTSSFNIKTTTKMIVSVQYTNTGICTVNLPAIDSTTDEYMWYIKDDDINAGTNNITINPDGSDTIETASSYVMDEDGQGILIYADRNLANWIVL